MKVIVVTLVHGGEVTVCKVFVLSMREQAAAFWEGLNEGKADGDEARISIEDVADHDHPPPETGATTAVADEWNSPLDPAVRPEES